MIPTKLNNDVLSDLKDEYQPTNFEIQEFETFNLHQNNLGGSSLQPPFERKRVP